MRVLLLLAAVGCSDGADFGDFAGDYVGSLGASSGDALPCSVAVPVCDGTTFPVPGGDVSGSCTGTIAFSDLEDAGPLGDFTERRTALVSFELSYGNVTLRASDLPALLGKSANAVRVTANVDAAGQLAGVPVSVVRDACEGAHPFVLSAEKL